MTERRIQHQNQKRMKFWEIDCCLQYFVSIMDICLISIPIL